jgi:hypothetical protein
LFEIYKTLEEISKTEYKDIVAKTELIHRRTIGSTKLRIIFKNSSFLDIWLSKTGKYSYHWEMRAINGKIYRHDNASDFPEIDTFPKHLHDGDEKSVKPSHLPDNPKKALRKILLYIKDNLWLP